ncbi:MAG: thiamine pyrophosphate-requiring protein [Chloroflexi bacterium]|nr:thiamine pyrophosphate-requiring protein [Chloroflexota bacterium]
MAKQASVDSLAEAYLELLAARGIEYFFGNGGTDFAPIIEAYAKRQAQEQVLPRPIPVPHEVTAVSMALGYTMATGKPQVVMVHTTPGTANAISGIINASRGNIPMLFSAGRTPISDGNAVGSRDGGIHWSQEVFDQGGMLREWVKWDYELHHGVDLESVVDRALAISQSEPAGPVYLTLPREVLAEHVDGITYHDQPLMNKAAETGPSPEVVSQVARALAKAKNPILITRTVGRDPRAVQPLVELAELLGMPVYEAGGNYVNFPKTHALYAGTEVGGVLPQADVVLVVEADVPWIPKRTGPRDDALVVGMGVDPLFSRYPMRTFRTDVNMAGSPRLAFLALTAAIRGLGVDQSAAKARIEASRKAGVQRREETAKRAEAGKGQTPINKAYFSRCLAEAIDDNTVILNELGVDLTQIEFSKPGAFYGGSVAGSLGWSIGASLGVKLASPEKTVVCCVGDGSYIFGSGEAGHMVSDVQGLPVLTIVWNNGIWNAVQNSTRMTYPNGIAARNNNFAVSTLSQAFGFEKICEAGGGYGERVVDPAEVPAAIRRALKVVREEKRQALLNVVGDNAR